MAIEGEKERAYTGPECPMRRREDDGWWPAGSAGELSALLSSDQTRMYDSAVPTATRALSPENSMQLMLSNVLWKVNIVTLMPGPTPPVRPSIRNRSRFSLTFCTSIAI